MIVDSALEALKTELQSAKVNNPDKEVHFVDELGNVIVKLGNVGGLVYMDVVNPDTNDRFNRYVGLQSLNISLHAIPR